MTHAKGTKDEKSAPPILWLQTVFLDRKVMMHPSEFLL